MPPVQFNQWAGRGVQPFAIYGKEGIMGEIGKGLSALGQIPQTIEDQRIQNEINKLVLQAITSPKTETETTQEEIPTFTLPEEQQEDYQRWPANKSILTPPSEQPTFGESLTQEPTGTTILKSQREVPGKQYTQATQRLRDIGYANKDQGVNFAPKSVGQTLAERMELETLKGNIRKDITGTTEAGKTERQTQRLEAAQVKQDRLIEAQNKRHEISEANRVNIANNKNKSEEQIARELLAERSMYHQGSLANFKDRTNAIRQVATSNVDYRKINQLNQWHDDLTKLRSQIDKIDAKPDQANATTIAERNTAIEQYNNTVDNIQKLDPTLGSGLIRYTAEDMSLFERLRRPGGVPEVIGGAVGLGTTPQKTVTQPGTVRPPPAAAAAPGAGTRPDPRTTYPGAPQQQGAPPPQGTSLTEEEIKRRMEQRGLQYRGPAGR